MRRLFARRRRRRPPWLVLLVAFALIVRLWPPHPPPVVRVRMGGRVTPVALETYVCGVVAAEMPLSAPRDALAALAVAARTYALWRHLRLDDGTDAQLYRPPTTLSPALRRRACAAADGTRGLYLEYGGRPALAAYSADAGPWSESAAAAFGQALPYLPAHPDPFGVGAPVWHRRLVVPARRWLRVVGAVRPRLVRDAAGHVLRIGAVPADRVARRLGLPSTDFRYRWQGGDVVVDVYGDGHGVGLDEWGAIRMAEAGADWRAILAFYYPGTRLAHLAGD
jgi:stage II sporulation protein D